MCVTQARPAEIGLIVAQHQSCIDALVAELDIHMENVAAIEKLRADRVAVHGDAGQ